VRILVVDDHADIRTAVCTILKSHKNVRFCYEAANGEEAVRNALELLPDLVVLDVYMPVLDGFTAARKIRERLPKLPILMMTANHDPDLREISVSVGAQGFLHKNDIADSLLHATETLLARGTFFPDIQSY
jgi:NarL family two-component system response regulator YdfI